MLSLGLQLPDPLPSPQRIPRDDRFVELGTTGGDAGLGLGLSDQRGDIGQHLGGQEGPGLLGLGGYFCLGGDLLDLPPGHPGLAIAQHHPHPGALGREETEIGRSHEESFREERKTTSRAGHLVPTARAAALNGAGRTTRHEPRQASVFCRPHPGLVALVRTVGRPRRSTVKVGRKLEKRDQEPPVLQTAASQWPDNEVGAIAPPVASCHAADRGSHPAANPAAPLLPPHHRPPTSAPCLLVCSDRSV